jgi:hypothetical protein
MNSAHIKIPADVTAQFLADIHVFLGYEYAEPGRLLFPQFAPHFAQFRDLPLAEHLEQAYLAIADSDQRSLIRNTVADALIRCAYTPLGVNRSLVVIDIVQAIAKEQWTNDIWLKLLWRPTDVQDLARWVGALVLRWAQWNVHVSLDEPDVDRLIASVEPTRFKNLIEYLLACCASKTSDGSAQRDHVLAKAQTRIRIDARQFADEDVDCAAIRDFLTECDTSGVQMTTDASAHGEKDELERELESRWPGASNGQSPWHQHDPEIDEY